jgi:sulfatase maturation enzyme AslB (radical SAM superfamily)
MTSPGTPADPLRRVRTLELILTASCNLGCSYCYQNAKQGRRMEWETLRTALDIVLLSDPSEVVVIFYGGEPLLELPLIRRAVAHVAAARSAQKHVHYAMSTNGMLLDEETATFLAEHRFETQLSFDGVPAAQAARGLGTHARLDALLDRLRRDHPLFYRHDFRTSITLHSGNLHHLADSVAYFLDKRVARIAFGTLFTHDAGWTDAHRAELDRQFARMFERSIRHHEDTGEVPLDVFRRTTDRDPMHAPQGRSMCGVGGGEALAVDVDGQVTGCVTFAGSYQRLPSDLLEGHLAAMRMGDVRDEALPRRLALYPEAARAAGIFNGKHKKRSSYARCGECRFLEDCSVCPTSIGHIPGNTDPDRVPDHLCAYNLVSLAYKQRFPRLADPMDVLTGRAPEPRLLRELRELAGG